MSSGKCARAFRVCDEPAGGYNGRFPQLCWKCARARLTALEMRRKQRSHSLLGRAR